MSTTCFKAQQFGISFTENCYGLRRNNWTN